MLSEFPSFLEKIDKNINLLISENYSSKYGNSKTNQSKLLKETNILLNSANSILTKATNSASFSSLNDENVFLKNKKIEKYYKELINRKKNFAEISRQLQERLLGINNGNNKQKKIILNNDEEEDEDLNFNEEKNKKLNGPVELELLTDYNERLLGDAIKNINKTNQNIEETVKDTKEQGNKLNEIYYKVENNDNKAKFGTNIINAITFEEKVKRISLIIINVILFLSIILLLVYKFI